jgi:hypothetical protein
MAHKKAGGSSRNGRDSNSKRLGVKNLVVRLLFQATSFFVNAAPNGTRVQMSVLVKIIRFLLPHQVMWHSSKKPMAAHMYQ